MAAARWSSTAPLAERVAISLPLATNSARAAAIACFQSVGNFPSFRRSEHAMAAAMNGIALHGGLIPYGGTFLCFSDYCRPSIRLASLTSGRFSS